MSVVSASLWHVTGTVCSPPSEPACSPSPGLVSPCVHTYEDQRDEHKDADHKPPIAREADVMDWPAAHYVAPTEELQSGRIPSLTIRLECPAFHLLKPAHRLHDDHQAQQKEMRHAAGSNRQDNDLVFPSRVGTPADASHVRRSFRTVVAAAGLDPHEWTPRELRHSFVSLLSDADVPIEQISRLVGHSSSTTTETIYRKQIRPVIVHGADVMDRIFPGSPDRDA